MGANGEVNAPCVEATHGHSHPRSQMTRAPGRRGGPRDSGAAAVELALILPILILVIAGIVDFGRAYFTQVTLTNAAREGARAAVVRVSPAEVEIRTQAALGPLAPGTTIAAGACPATGGTNVTVTVTRDFDWIILEPMMNFVGGSNLPPVLESAATMRCGG
jgi:Flp pilus assembly protein TadG